MDLLSTLSYLNLSYTLGGPLKSFKSGLGKISTQLQSNLVVEIPWAHAYTPGTRHRFYALYAL